MKRFLCELAAVAAIVIVLFLVFHKPKTVKVQDCNTITHICRYSQQQIQILTTGARAMHGNQHRLQRQRAVYCQRDGYRYRYFVQSSTERMYIDKQTVLCLLMHDHVLEQLEPSTWDSRLHDIMSG